MLLPSPVPCCPPAVCTLLSRAGGSAVTPKGGPILRDLWHAWGWPTSSPPLCGAEPCRGLVHPQPCALSIQGPVAVPLHLSPVELVLVCSPQTDTAACATRATRCTPAISAAWVCQHLL